MFFERTAWYAATLLLATAAAERWQWPESREGRSTAAAAASVRIDTKVRFVDEDHKGNNIQSDESSHQQGFYSRPSSDRFSGQSSHRAPYRVSGVNSYPVTTYRPPSDGTLDSIEQCKCVSTLDCSPRPDPSKVCKSGQYLCCYKRPNKSTVQNSEYINEVDNDEPPVRRPGRPGIPLLPNNNGFGNFAQNQDSFLGGNNRPSTKPDVLVGPDGSTGQVGPSKLEVLVGPEGPTGHIGPQNGQFLRPFDRNENIGSQQNPGVLVGPGGPTGIIGPDFESQKQQGFDGQPSGTAQRGVLVGPGGPTGIIGPYNQQRPVLVGPGGPTGIIGPNRGFNRGYNRGVLVGPGGPTGIIGPGYGRQSGPGLLVGPGGPTGTIGPGRSVLVGPGGPTGQIGPRRYYL